MSGWGNSWNKGQWGKFNTEPKEYPKDIIERWSGIDLAKEPSVTVYGVYTAEGFVNLTAEEEFQKRFKNIAPTHDPYTNPNAHIYYECGCGVILDPGTKSFAQLNNCASALGWKVRWGANSYVPYCVKCGEDVE